MKERMFFIMAIFPERINVVTLYDDNNNAVQLEKFYLILLADLDAEDANEGKWVVLEGRQSVINYLSDEFYNGIDPLKSYILTGNIRLGNEVSKIMMLKEEYPELKADKNFMRLQDDLSEIEDSIAKSRSIYNKNVLNYKNNIEVFPSNIIASIFGFKQELFFEINKEEKENPTIKFE